jgi:sugar/nucleoside kinase (ribokinase family)
MLLALADVFPVVALKLGADGSAGLDRTGLGCYGGCSTGHSRGRFGSHSAGRSVGRSYGGSIVHASPVQVEAVDTNGAGDAFDAGFVVEYSSGGGLEAALMRGNAMGARVAAMHGAR